MERGAERGSLGGMEGQTRGWWGRKEVNVVRWLVSLSESAVLCGRV